MSVCFFVPAENAATTVEETEHEGAEEVVPTDNSQQTLQQFWSNVMDDIKKVNADDFKTQALPLARIKKIMKLDEEVKMISAEAPVMFAKAAEIFIHELTLRAWQHTEDNKRRTLQRNDIAMAISKSDQFDFLIDIVPRHEVKSHKPREELHTPAPRTDQYCVQLSGQTAVSHPHTQFVIQPSQNSAAAAILQQQQQQQPSAGVAGPAGVAGVAGVAGAAGSVPVQQPVTIVQQLLTAGGEVQQVPIQLSAAQLNMIRLQVQNNPGQPIVIQAQHTQHQPQIIQVTSQGQHQPQQQVYLAQVATTQDDS